MKLLLTTIAAVLVVGCGESQQSAPAPEAKPVEPVAEAAKPEPATAKASFISIHEAAEAGNIESVKQALADGADVNAKNEDGVTPLSSAAYFGHKKVVELLIAKDADVNAKDNLGDTPIDWAVAWDEPEIADLLRKHGGKTGEELKDGEPVAEVAKTESPTQKENHKKICFNQLKQIDGRKEMWAVQERRADGDFPTEAQIASYSRDGMPSCPGGGVYTIGAVGNQASCSIHGKLARPDIQTRGKKPVATGNINPEMPNRSTPRRIPQR